MFSPFFIASSQEDVENSDESEESDEDSDESDTDPLHTSSHRHSIRANPNLNQCSAGMYYVLILLIFTQFCKFLNHQLVLFLLLQIAPDLQLQEILQENLDDTNNVEIIPEVLLILH